LPGGVGREKRRSPTTQPVKAESASGAAELELTAATKVLPELTEEELDEVPVLEVPVLPTAGCESSWRSGCSAGVLGWESAGALQPAGSLEAASENSGNSGLTRLPEELPTSSKLATTTPAIHGARATNAEPSCVREVIIGVLSGAFAPGLHHTLADSSMQAFPERFSRKF
jgi:hypothetical protein